MRFWPAFRIGLALFVAIWAAPAGAQDAVCKGTQIDGPWYRFLLPEGMQLEGGPDRKVTQNSVWISSGIGPEKTMFFLFAPQHGGKPYRAYLGAKQVTNYIDIPTENGPQQTFGIEYEDGSHGLFEGNAQKFTGLRIYQAPLDALGFQNYQCFLQSIESYSD